MKIKYCMKVIPIYYIPLFHINLLPTVELNSFFNVCWSAYVRARSSVVGWGTMLQTRKVAGSIPDEVIEFFNWPNPSSRTMALGSTQPLTEMGTRNIPGGNGRPTCKANKLTAVCEPIV
jgi:hypothetical protein